MSHPYTIIYNLADSLPTQRGGSVVINLFIQHTHRHRHTHTQTHTHTRTTHSEADNQGSPNIRKLGVLKTIFKKGEFGIRGNV